MRFGYLTQPESHNRGTTKPCFKQKNNASQRFDYTIARGIASKSILESGVVIKYWHEKAGARNARPRLIFARHYRCAN
jgi:hypothetical protein